jgi:hypothetical protein
MLSLAYSPVSVLEGFLVWPGARVKPFENVTLAGAIETLKM